MQDRTVRGEEVKDARGWVTGWILDVDTAITNNIVGLVVLE